jgi:hypothetical protein
MEIKATFLPGQNGTKELQRKYGDKLVCVRYRYDQLRQKRVKTIELIVDEKDWIPKEFIASDKKVQLRIDYKEEELRNKVKTAGGYWDPETKAWQLTYKKAMELGLKNRIQQEEK